MAGEAIVSLPEVKKSWGMRYAESRCPAGCGQDPCGMGAPRKTRTRQALPDETIYGQRRLKMLECGRPISDEVDKLSDYRVEILAFFPYHSDIEGKRACQGSLNDTLLARKKAVEEY